MISDSIHKFRIPFVLNLVNVLHARAFFACLSVFSPECCLCSTVIAGVMQREMHFAFDSHLENNANVRTE